MWIGWVSMKLLQVLAQKYIPNVKDVLIKITKGRGLTGAHLTDVEKKCINDWLQTQPNSQGIIYRVIRVDVEKFFKDHLYNFTQKTRKSDKPIKVNELSSWTKDRRRVYAYGNPKSGQDAIRLELDASLIRAVDISEYSVYPEEKEVLNADNLFLNVISADYNKSLGWQLKLKPAYN